MRTIVALFAVSSALVGASMLRIAGQPLEARANGAIDLTIDRVAMRRAVDLARWPKTAADRERFHRPYVFDLPPGTGDGATIVERIEVTTAYRRLVQIAEEHAATNDLFGQPGLTDADAAIRPWRGRVALTAHVKFAALADAPARMAAVNITIDDQSPAHAIAISRTPSYDNCAPDASCAITGALIVATFAAEPLAQSTRQVTVRVDARPLAAVVVDFSELD